MKPRSDIAKEEYNQSTSERKEVCGEDTASYW